MYSNSNSYGLEGKMSYGSSSNYGSSGSAYNSCCANPSASYQNPANSFASSIQNNYRVSNSVNSSYDSKPSITYNGKMAFSADPFINKMSGPSVFVDSAEKIEPLIKEAFKATTGNEFPNDIIVSVCDDNKMMQNHPGWTPAISGFAINSYPRKIFVREDNLENVMVVLGHEIGHVVSENLSYDVDEEAKAFSFCIAWIKAIKENNIGKLSNNLVVPEPAKNGVHNVALNFVLEKINDGLGAFDLFELLASKTVNIFKGFEVC